MLYIFLDYGYLKRNYPEYLGNGGKVIDIKKNIENVLSYQSEKLFVHYPPPFVHNPPKQIDIQLQKQYSKLQRALSKETELEFITVGKTIPVQCKGCKYETFRQRQVDVGIVTHILHHYYEKAMKLLFLIAGDQDFVPVLKFLSEKGMQLYIPEGRNVSRELLSFTQKSITIDSILYA